MERMAIVGLLPSLAALVIGWTFGAGWVPWPAAAAAAAMVLTLGWMQRRWLLGRAPRRERQAPSSGSAPEAGYEDFIEALPWPALLVRRSGILFAANEQARSLSPVVKQGELVTLAFRAPQFVDALRLATAHGGPVRADFVERIPVERWFEAHLVPLWSLPSANAAQLVLLVLEDRTAIRRAEQSRADFVANASHELRTPLASLSAFIETLQGAARDDTVSRERFLGIMRDQARRMARLIDDLLSLSRVELNQHVRPATLVDIGALIRQAVDALGPLAREFGSEIELSLPVDPLHARGDPDELLRVFENLLDNAMKYGAAGGPIAVTASIPASDGTGPELRVEIADTGPGIAPEHLPRLTERFYRVNEGESRARGGTGLGLALVKHILNRHRGRLTIASTLGEGSVFTVSLPLHQVSPATSENAPSPAS